MKILSSHIIPCREAPALANDLSIAHVLVASNCKEVVNDINNRTSGMHGNIIIEIVATTVQFQSQSWVIYFGTEGVPHYGLSLQKITLFYFSKNYRKVVGCSKKNLVAERLQFKPGYDTWGPPVRFCRPWLTAREMMAVRAPS